MSIKVNLILFCLLISVAIDLIVQHIRDFLNNRAHYKVDGCSDRDTPSLLSSTSGTPSTNPSPGTSPLHGPTRRYHSGDGGHFTRPH